MTNGAGDHTLMGSRHPLNNMIYPDDAIVLKKDFSGWVKEWVKWLVSIPPDDSPLNRNYVENPYEEDKTQNQKAGAGRPEGVWFLAAPGYGSGTTGMYSKYVIIERGMNNILFSPAIFFNSGRGFGEYPSKSDADLFKMAVDDLNSINKIAVRLDGLNLYCVRVEIDKAFPTKVKYPNIIGIEKSEFGGAKDKDTNMVCAGYFTFLAPLSPGLHLLEYEGYTKNYSLAVSFQLNVRGP